MAVAKNNVVQMPTRSTATAKRRSELKWSREVMEAKRFCIFPSLLLHAQARLKLTPTHLAVVMHLIDFWWQADRMPWPSKATLAERMGLSQRQIPPDEGTRGHGPCSSQGTTQPPPREALERV